MAKDSACPWYFGSSCDRCKKLPDQGRRMGKYSFIPELRGETCQKAVLCVTVRAYFGIDGPSPKGRAFDGSCYGNWKRTELAQYCPSW
ncbi:hypothetical protein PJL15_04291 [Paenarthrobacter nitroguajacolicus]|nr:hypothetical protein [Paenarthrobacter nitroguajacolicus]